MHEKLTTMHFERAQCKSNTRTHQSSDISIRFSNVLASWLQHVIMKRCNLIACGHYTW